MKRFEDRIIEPKLSESSMDELSELKHKYRGLIIKTCLFWIFISNVTSFFLNGVVESPTSSSSYIVFKQLLYVLILFIQSIANHFTTIRISTLFSISIQLLGTLYLILGFFYNSPQYLLIGQLAFIGYISLCLVILFIIQQFASTYGQSVGLIRDYWLAIHLGTFLGQYLAMQHCKLPTDPTKIQTQDENNEKWDFTTRQTIIIVTFSLSSVIIVSCYFIFSKYYLKIERKKLMHFNYVRFINFKQIHLPFSYIKTILKRTDFAFIISFVSTLTLLNSVSSTLISIQKEVNPEEVLGIKTLAVILAALFVSIRHQRPNAVVNVYKDILSQNILLLISYLSLFLIEYLKMSSSLQKFIITFFCIFILQFNLAILLSKVFLLQHNIFPQRFSFKVFIYGLFRCLQFLIGLVDALLISRFKTLIVYITFFVWLLQIINTYLYIRNTSFKKLNKLLLINQ